MEYSPDIDVDAVLATYKPLSQLPTPPPSFERVKQRIQEPYGGGDGGNTDPTTALYTAFASHLSSLLPSNALHLTTPASAFAISALLQRADLSDSILGLTACVIESLSNCFVRSWRQACFYARVRSPRADTIILAALTIATGFLDDKTHPTRWWSEEVAGGDIGVKDINMTVRCILLDVDYDIHSFTAEMIADAVAEMKGSAGYDLVAEAEMSTAPIEDTSTLDSMVIAQEEEEKDNRRDSGYSSGEAVWQHGDITPEPTPPALAYDVPFLRLL